jgi:hypothetical protein
METHVHSHSHGKKNWKTYLWEFLMLFLAVFCGFLAEYKLEHTIEHQREKDYIQSLLPDIRKDTMILNTIIEKNELQVKGKDSLEQLIKDGEVPPGKVEYFYDLYWRYVGYTNTVTFTKRTLTQLLNAGGLRLIRNQKVSDAIAEYGTGVEHLEKVIQEDYLKYSYKSLDASQKVADIQYVSVLPDERFERTPHGKPKMRNASPGQVKDFNFMLELDKEFTINFITQLKRYRVMAEELIVLIKKEYHIE